MPFPWGGGGGKYGRFMECLCWVIEKNLDKFPTMLRISSSNLELHSARNGVCSKASENSTVNPPMVSTCLRAMCSMGSVKEQYLHYEKARDQYLGLVSWLDVKDISFAISPP